MKQQNRFGANYSTHLCSQPARTFPPDLQVLEPVYLNVRKRGAHTQWHGRLGDSPGVGLGFD